MPLQYGVNILASDMREMLEQNDKQNTGVKTWRQLFGNAALGAQSQSSAATSAYSDAIAQAYRANLEQQNRILNAGLGTNATKDLLSISRQELADTYNNYLSNYQSAMADVSESYNTEVNTISEALDERAQNFADLYNSAYQYLNEELFGATGQAIDTSTPGTPIYSDEGKNPQITGYTPNYVNLNYMQEHGLDWLIDQKSGELMSWNDIGKMIMNSDGTLNEKGIEFFDQMFNARPEDYLNIEGERVRGFDEWLGETNAELRDWLASADEFNYTFAGTNMGSAKAFAGLESTDDTAARIEYTNEGYFTQDFGANDINTSYSNFEKDLSGLNDELNKLRNEVNKYQALYNSYKDDKRLSVEYSTKLKQMKEKYQEAQDKYNSSINEFAKNLSDTYSSTLKNLKSSISSEDYNNFVSNNEQLLNSLDDYLKFIVDTNHYKENRIHILEEFINDYNKLVNAIRQYGKSLTTTKKASGQTSGF